MFFVLILLSLAQFILTLDTTFMNVSISALVRDLDTTVPAVQTAISLYTLVMAAFLLTGAKIGDVIGRKRAFVIGLIVYGIGSFITSISPNIYMLIFGWSFLEGLGAAIVIPAMISLVSANFPKGPERVKAYGILAAVAAAGAAAGPIIGGFLTTYITWRLGFLGEVAIVIYILLQRKNIKDAAVGIVDKRFDYFGLVLSVLGLGVLITGIILANTYGIITARVPFVVDGNTLISVGEVSPTVWVVGIGLIILALFMAWEFRRSKRNKAVLINPALLRSRVITPGIITTLAINFVMVGTIFAVSIVCQIMLEYSAFLSGVVLLPLSFGVLLLGLTAGRMAKRFYPKRLIQLGVLLLLAGSVLFGFSVRENPTGVEFIPSLFLIGAGVGMSISQLNNLIQSSVPPEKSNEASGVNSTFQYLGSSLGTALSGSIILAAFVLIATGFISESNVFSDAEKTQVNNTIETKAQTLSSTQLNNYLKDAPEDQRAELVDINYKAQQQAISLTAIILSIMGATGLISSIFLPKERLST